MDRIRCFDVHQRDYCLFALYICGVVICAHSVRGEPPIQRNASGVVAALAHIFRPSDLKDLIFFCHFQIISVCDRRKTDQKWVCSFLRAPRPPIIQRFPQLDTCGTGCLRMVVCWQFQCTKTGYLFLGKDVFATMDCWETHNFFVSYTSLYEIDILSCLRSSPFYRRWYSWGCKKTLRQQQRKGMYCFFVKSKNGCPKNKFMGYK